MTDFEPNIKAKLILVSEVTALIGDRVFLGKIPQANQGGTNRMDCCVYQRVGADRQPKHCATDNLVGASYQVDSYSPNRDRLPAIARAIRRALIDYPGPMGDCPVSRVTLDNDFDSTDETPGLFRRTQLFTIWHQE